MTTASNPLLDALDWIGDQLDWLFATVFGEDFDWDHPDPPEPIDDLPGFDPTLSEPAPRKCCTIGWRPVVWFFGPFATSPVDLSDLGTHHYGGPSLLENASFISPDPVGHAYTTRGGIIDLGHLRDHADLARYAASHAWRLLETGGVLELPSDGAELRAHLNPKPDRTPVYCALLGARISYDWAIWHELKTAFANPGIPVVGDHQPFSAFSPEDNFSNLLGAWLGYRAILRPIDFNEAMTNELTRRLTMLGVVGSTATTDAVEYVAGHWFHYPEGTLELKRRHIEPFGDVRPWQITDAQPPVTEDRPTPDDDRAAMIVRFGIPPKAVLPEPPRDDAIYTLEVEIDPSHYAKIEIGPTLSFADMEVLVDQARTEFGADNGTSPE